MFQRKSDGLWVEQITLDGKTRRVTAKTKTALKNKLAAMDIQRQQSFQFGEVADAWAESKAASIAYNTYCAYKPHIERLRDYFGDRSISDITPAEVQAFIDRMAAQGYARDTVHRALVVCSMIFDHAILMPGSTLRYNSCSAVKVPRGLKKTRREPPTNDQLAKITPDTEMGLFAWFLLYTGLRRGELLALRWDDIDRDNKLIHVGRAVSFQHNRPVLKDPKTAAGNRDVDLLDVLAEVLPAQKTGYVFGGKEPWSETTFKKRWLAWCREIGCATSEETVHTGRNGHRYTAVRWKPTITPHQFRHWYATLLEGAGVSEFAAKSVLGHSSILVTKDIYTHIRDAKQARPGAQIDNYIKDMYSKSTVDGSCTDE